MNKISKDLSKDDKQNILQEEMNFGPSFTSLKFEESKDNKENSNNLYISPYSKYKREKKFDNNQEVLEKNKDKLENNLKDNKQIGNNYRIYLNNKGDEPKIGKEKEISIKKEIEESEINNNNYNNQISTKSPKSTKNLESEAEKSLQNINNNIIFNDNENDDKKDITIDNLSNIPKTDNIQEKETHLNPEISNNEIKSLNNSELKKKDENLFEENKDENFENKIIESEQKDNQEIILNNKNDNIEKEENENINKA